MTSSSLKGNEFFRQLFESAPCGMLIADSNGHVRALNPEGGKLFCVKFDPDNLQTGGELFRCVNSSGGCGTASACKTCILRTNAMIALSGKTVSTQKGKFTAFRDAEIKQFTLLVSAAPVVYRQEKIALLIIEDISVVTELSGLIPICSCCHRIRDDNGEWINFTKYLQDHSEADLTHDYCPSCMQEQSKVFAKTACG